MGPYTHDPPSLLSFPPMKGMNTSSMHGCSRRRRIKQARNTDERRRRQGRSISYSTTQEGRKGGGGGGGLGFASSFSPPFGHDVRTPQKPKVEKSHALYPAQTRKMSVMGKRERGGRKGKLVLVIPSVPRGGRDGGGFFPLPPAA